MRDPGIGLRSRELLPMAGNEATDPLIGWQNSATMIGIQAM